MNFLGMGPMELLLIIILALIVFGPAKLPEIMAQVGKAINDFRRATSDLSEEFNKTIQAELADTKTVVDEAKSAMTEARTAVSEVHTSVNSAVTGLPAPTRVAEPGTNGSSTLNGTTSEPKPALADTSQWSWETAAPPSETATSVADAAPPTPTVTESETTPKVAESDTAAPIEPEVAPPPKPKPAPLRDELAPPY